MLGVPADSKVSSVKLKKESLGNPQITLFNTATFTGTGTGTGTDTGTGTGTGRTIFCFVIF